MLFYPYGQRKGEVADPKNLTREYQNAQRLAQQTTHYQWGESGLSLYSTPVVVSSTSQSVNLGGGRGVAQESGYMDLK